MPRVILPLIAILLLLAVWFYPGADPSSPEAPVGRAPFEDDGRGEPGPLDDTLSEGLCSIEGVVRRGGRLVVAQVEVRPLDDGDWLGDELIVPGSSVRVVEADATAGFSAVGLPPGTFEIRAIARDGAFGTARTYLAATGARARVDIAIPDGPHTVRGVAMWSDGRPFRGLVAVGSKGGGRDEVVTGWAETGAAGRFSISGLHTGSHRLAACLPGRFRVFSGRIPVPHQGELSYVVDAGMTPVEGRVVVSRTGEAVPDADVVIETWSAGGSSLVSRVRADAEGRFQDRALAFRAGVEVSAPGYYLVGSESEDADPHIVATMERAGRITGRVITASGRPLAGVPVFAASYSDQTVAVSDTDGGFSVEDVRAYDTRVFAAGQGWCSVGETEVLVPAGGTARVDLIVVRSATLTGKVLDHEGRPVAGAVVTAGDFWCADLRVASDREGAFRIGSLVPDAEVSLSVAAPGLARIYTSAPPIGPGQTGDVTIRLPPPRTVGVRVLDAATGAPLAGAVVSYGVREGLTDSTGLARIGPLPAGDLELVVFHPDALNPRAEIRIPEGDAPDAVEVRIERGLTITGRIVLPGGGPFEHGHVWTRWEHSTYYFARGPGADCGVDGRFVVRGLLPGGHSISALAVAGNVLHRGEAHAEAGRRGVVIEVRPDEEDVEEDDEPENEAEIVVKILGPDGHLVPRCEAALRIKDGEEVDQIRVDALHGIARFYLSADDLKGALFIEVSNAVRFTGEPLPFGATLAGPFSPDLLETTIVLPEERVIEGRVVRPDGEGIPDIEIDADAILPFGLGESGTHGSGRTGKDGTFRIGGLGDFEVLLDGELTARPGDTGIVIRYEDEPDLKLAPTEPPETLHVVRGRVVLPSGQPTSRCRIWLDYRDPIRPFYDGSFVIRDLPAGQHEVLVLPDGLSRWEEEAEDWKPQTINAPDEEAELILDPSWELRIRVRNRPSGVGSSDVHLLPENGTVDRGATLRAGDSLLFRRLPPGSRFTLWIPPVGDGYSLLRAGIHSGKPDLVVDLEKGREITGRIEGELALDRVEVEAEYLEHPGIGVAGEVRPDGTFTIRGLPEGRWKVKVTGWIGEENTWSDRQTVRAGEQVSFRPRR